MSQLLPKLPVAAILVIVAGCSSRPAAVKKPDWDPAESAEKAVADADRNGDSLLSKGELKAYPSLLSSFSQFDKDGDSQLSIGELQKEFELWAKRGAAIRSLNCTVKLGGRPLPGALVEFVPEPFMGEGIKPCSGTCDEYGMAVMSLDKDHLPADLQSFPGVHLAMYRVRVTHPNRDIPAKYNEESTIGAVVGPAVRDISLNLAGR